MLRGHLSKLTVFTLAAFILFGSCRKREGFSLPDNYIVFTTDAQGISETENSIVIKVKLTRGTDKDIPVVVKIAEQGAQYGTKYTTTPAASNGEINLTVPSGNNEASFTVNKVAGVLFEGTEKLVFDLYSSGSPILIGNTKQLTLSFAELVSTNSTLVLTGGGPTYPNKVFVDLSANRQTAVLRTNWDLGFYTDAADFKVILNSSTGMTAKQINKNDLTQVTIADTVGFLAEMGSLVGSPAQLPLVDYPTGDLSKTALGLIAATASDNKVFIVNRGVGVGSPLPARGWKKIRVIRNASGGYTLQHADIAATTFSSIDIPKDDKYFFNYVSFESGAVSVEPEKAKWDIAWT
ncbi:MAG: HmuY family protein, partial [Chitinophagaceae bacterium]